ncbi:MAG: hypothetical protein LBQ39_07790 [Tannerellaceae bacterium]|jgi:hypothetical protein|nr:hypothetical protein [Tannerellaceae bacterium]
MEIRKLEAKDIAGYVAYSQRLSVRTGRSSLIHYANSISAEYLHITDFDVPIKIEFCRPILRPVTDLYETINYCGEEIIPISECAKIEFKDRDFDKREWTLGKTVDGFPCAKRGYSYFRLERYHFALNECPAYRQLALFDYLNRLKIDYRGLIPPD